MDIKVDKGSSIPIYLQIVNQIRMLIMSGSLPAGYRLPPERKLADEIGVNRTTVLNAYRELKTECLIGSHVGKGTVVLQPGKDFESDTVFVPSVPIWSQFQSDYASRFDSLALQNMRRVVNNQFAISFATGTPNTESLTFGLGDVVNSEMTISNLLFPALESTVEGHLYLREKIAAYMRKRGCSCVTDEVMILSGSQQGIDLIVRSLINPGDVVIIEEPSFLPAIQAFRTAGARLMGIPIDKDGMRTDLLESMILRYRPKLIYTIPSFHNPTGTTLTLERRKELLELSMKHNILVLEDDAYGSLQYDGKPILSLKSMENLGYVIYLSTFSKIMHPGFRIGWLVANKEYIRQFAGVRQMIDLHSSSVSQNICQKLLESDLLESYLTTITKEYKSRRDTMVDAFVKNAPPKMSWHIPQGGFYLWCRLPDEISSTQLLALTMKKDVVFMPGNMFFISGQEERCIRLNFVYPPKKDIAKGVKVICDAVRELIQQNKNTSSDVSEIEIIR